MAKSHLKLVTPAIVKRTVTPGGPRGSWRRPKATAMATATPRWSLRPTGKACEQPRTSERHRAIGCFRRPLGDHDFGRDEGLALTTCASPRDPKQPPSAQAGRQLSPQRASFLERTALDRLLHG
jgi:hypothetical protein